MVKNKAFRLLLTVPTGRIVYDHLICPNNGAHRLLKFILNEDQGIGYPCLFFLDARLFKNQLSLLDPLLMGMEHGGSQAKQDQEDSHAKFIAN